MKTRRAGTLLKRRDATAARPYHNTLTSGCLREAESSCSAAGGLPRREDETDLHRRTKSAAAFLRWRLAGGRGEAEGRPFSCFHQRWITLRQGCVAGARRAPFRTTP